MTEIENFLTQEEELEVVEAIKIAEENTSGEIRIHIEKTTTLDPNKRAAEVFNFLNMDKTALKNGVLIYLAIHDKKFVICGDKGINDVVPNDFWDSTKNEMQQHFKTGNFKQGLINGVLKAGEKLKIYFPFNEKYVDELPNEISKG